MYARVRTERLDDLPDADLICLFKSGDDEALEILLRRYADELYRFCCHLVPNREDAEDICQESLTRAIDRVGTLERAAAFRGWLFRIARNLSIDSFRQRRRTCALLDEEMTPPPLRVDGPHESVVVGEEHQTVAQALNRLAQSHQRVLMLREVEGLSYADIANRLNVSHSAVETLLFRARRRLREEYSKGDSCASGLIALAGLRDLVARLGAPLAGGGHLIAKVTLTTAVVSGTALSVSHGLPAQRAAPPARTITLMGQAVSHPSTSAIRSTAHLGHRAPTVAHSRSSPSVVPFGRTLAGSGAALNRAGSSTIAHPVTPRPTLRGYTSRLRRLALPGSHNRLGNSKSWGIRGASNGSMSGQNVKSVAFAGRSGASKDAGGHNHAAARAILSRASVPSSHVSAFTNPVLRARSTVRALGAFLRPIQRAVTLRPFAPVVGAGSAASVSRAPAVRPGPSQSARSTGSVTPRAPAIGRPVPVTGAPVTTTRQLTAATSSRGPAVTSPSTAGTAQRAYGAPGTAKRP
jgi:RNA polymerase sigma-70 factor, ECF subfamily